MEAGTREREAACAESWRGLLRVTGHLRFGVAGEWAKKLDRENKTRSALALEATRSHWGLGLRAVEVSRHERLGLAFCRGHSGS